MPDDIVTSSFFARQVHSIVWDGSSSILIPVAVAVWLANLICRQLAKHFENARIVSLLFLALSYLFSCCSLSSFRHVHHESSSSGVGWHGVSDDILFHTLHNPVYFLHFSVFQRATFSTLTRPVPYIFSFNKRLSKRDRNSLNSLQTRIGLLNKKP